MTTLTTRLRRISRELALFGVASFAMGIAYSLFDSVFNNFLLELFGISNCVFDGCFHCGLEFPDGAAGKGAEEE